MCTSYARYMYLITVNYAYLQAANTKPVNITQYLFL